jgi:hypothetical protein
MKQETSEMSSRQIFLLLGVFIFSLAGLVQLVVAILSPSLSAGLASLASWTLAFLAYRGMKQRRKKGERGT